MPYTQIIKRSLVLIIGKGISSSGSRLAESHEEIAHVTHKNISVIIMTTV